MNLQASLFDTDSLSLLFAVCAFLISIVSGVASPIIDGIAERKMERRKQIAAYIENFWKAASFVISRQPGALHDFTPTAWALESHLRRRAHRALVESFRIRVNEYTSLSPEAQDLQRPQLLANLEHLISALYSEMYRTLR